MTYKAVADRVPTSEAQFTFGDMREKMQKNGVRSATIRAVHHEGRTAREVHVFANGARLETLLPYVKKGEEVCLRGKWSQKNTFVCLGLAA